jgi:hypothetical protein
MEQKYIGAVESAAYGTMRALGSVVGSMSGIFYWLFPLKSREDIGTTERFSSSTEEKVSQASFSSRHAEPAASSGVFKSPLWSRITAPIIVKDQATPHAVKEERAKDAKLAHSLQEIEFTSKLECLKAETYVSDFMSPDKKIRVKSLEQIKKLSEASAIGVLKSLLLSSKESLQTVELISAISEINEKGFLDKRVLAGFLSNQNLSVRQTALRAVAKYRDNESFLYVSGALQDPEAEVRRQALNCLAWFFGDRCAPAVAKSMYDIDAGIRKSAALISGSMKLNHSISGLITLLSDSDHGVQKAASDSLIKITGRDQGFRVNGSAKSKSEAIEGWRFWWRDNQSKFTGSKK